MEWLKQIKQILVSDECFTDVKPVQGSNASYVMIHVGYQRLVAQGRPNVSRQEKYVSCLIQH
jgi:hypothetical protein